MRTMKNTFRFCLIAALALPCALFARRDEGLLLYMNFDDRSEPTKNISGTDREPQLLGPLSAPKLDDGKFVYSAMFTNANTNRSVDNCAINLGELDGYYQDSFSVAFWFRTEKKGSTEAMITGNKNWERKNEAGWALTTLKDETLSLTVGGKTVKIAFPQLTDGKWHHVALVVNRKSNTVALYGDGKCIGKPQPIPEGTIGKGGDEGNETLVGSSGNGYYALPGDKNKKALVDDYAIWKRALTEKEIVAMWKEGDGARVPEPSAFPLIFGGVALAAALALARRGRKKQK